MAEAIRWTIKVSKETDLSLRTMLGATIDEAVREVRKEARRRKK